MRGEERNKFNYTAASQKFPCNPAKAQRTRFFICSDPRRVMFFRPMVHTQRFPLGEPNLLDVPAEESNLV